MPLSISTQTIGFYFKCNIKYELIDLLNRSPRVKKVVHLRNLLGIQAAHAAKMKAIAVATTYSPPDLSSADICIPALANISVKQLPVSKRVDWIELEIQSLQQ